MVTVVGVAYRGGIALENIEVDFQVEPVEMPGVLGFGVRERVTLMGNLSETERVRLQRAARFCPVGQALNKGAMQVEDTVRWGNGQTAAVSPASESLPELAGAQTAIPAGSVQGRYLLDTKEYDGSGEMTHEGEAKVYVNCDNLTRSSTWAVLGGHSSQGLVPSPFPLAQAAWAASTAATLERLLPSVDDGAGQDIGVRLAMSLGGGRGDSQGSAARGEVRHRAISRRIDVPGSPESAPLEVVRAALRADPITAAYRHGGVLLEDEVVVA